MPEKPPGTIPGTIVDSNIHDMITAVDASDNSAAYPIDKLEAHIRNIRHAAISIFVFRGPYLLLQRRAETKYHSGGLWANTVCSHPRWQESFRDCADRRLEEELGWTTSVSKFGEIAYQARVGELYENEYVHCFHGEIDNRVDVQRFNPDEVSAVRWLTIPQILERMQMRPESFTEWFKIYMTQHRQMIDSLVADLDRNRSVGIN